MGKKDMDEDSDEDCRGWMDKGVDACFAASNTCLVHWQYGSYVCFLWSSRASRLARELPRAGRLWARTFSLRSAFFFFALALSPFGAAYKVGT
jgi:hypothetical protein